MIRRGAIATFAVTVLVGVLGLAQAASANDGTSPSSNSAAQQYVEALPTASGGGPSGGAGSTKQRPASKPSALPKKVRKSITKEGGSDAAVLRQVASSAALGAPPVTKAQTPQNTGTRTHASHGRGARAVRSFPVGSADRQSPFAAAFSVGHGLPVIVLLLALVALAVAHVVARRRVPRGARRASGPASRSSI